RLVEGKLIVGSEVPVSSGFDEDYYIERRMIRVEIDEERLNLDIKNGEFADQVVYQKEKFEEASHDDEANIHLLLKELDGLFWMQSKGSVESLVEYRKGNKTNDENY